MNKIFFIVILIVMTSCQKIIQQDTAVLSKHTQAFWKKMKKNYVMTYNLSLQEVLLRMIAVAFI